MSLDSMPERRFLHCYSTGDRRYSAHFARIDTSPTHPRGRSIETIYQGAKRDERGYPFEHPKGEQLAYLYLNNRLEPASNELKHEFYTALWYLYFLENPALFEEACGYDGFYEHPGEVFYKEEGQTFGLFLPYPFDNQIPRRCNQALSIAYLVYTTQQRIPRLALFPPVVIQAMKAYWLRCDGTELPLLY